MSDFQFQVMVSSQQYHKFTNCITENIKLQKRIKELSDQLEKNHERRDMMQMTIKNMQIKIRQLSKNSLKLSRGLISEKQDHEKTQQNGIVRQRQLLEKVLALTRERDLSYQNIDMLKQSLKKIMKEVENGKQSKRLLECRYKETVGIWEKVKKDNEELKQNIQKLVMTNKELSAQKQELIRLKENIMEQNERLKMELLSQNEVIFSKIKKYEQEVKSLLSDLQNCRNRQQYLSLSKEKDKIQYEQQIQAKNNEIDQLIQQKSYQLSVIKALDQSNQNYKISKINLSAKCQSLSEDILAMKQQWRQLLIWRKMISQMNFTQFGEQIKSYVGQLIQRNLKSQQQLKSLSYWQHIMPQMISKKQILEKDKIKEKYQVLAIEFKLILAEIESSFKRWLDSC